MRRLLARLARIDWSWPPTLDPVMTKPTGPSWRLQNAVGEDPAVVSSRRTAAERFVRRCAAGRCRNPQAEAAALVAHWTDPGTTPFTEPLRATLGGHHLDADGRVDLDPLPLSTHIDAAFRRRLHARAGEYRDRCGDPLCWCTKPDPGPHAPPPAPPRAEVPQVKPHRMYAEGGAGGGGDRPRILPPPPPPPGRPPETLYPLDGIGPRFIHPDAWMLHRREDGHDVRGPAWQRCGRLACWCARLGWPPQEPTP